MNDSLFERVRQAARAHNLSRKTEDAYVNHIRRFFAFNPNRASTESGAHEIGDFLAHLETNRGFAPSTLKQARSALVFFYREIFGCLLPVCFKSKVRARAAALPVIFTKDEVKAILSKLSGAPYLAAALMYGSGLRLNETLNLRVGDIDFIRREIIVRRANSGVKDHATILPRAIAAPLRKHLVEVRFLHEDDCLRGYGKVRPPADARYSQPDDGCEWRGQYAFPAVKLSANENGFYRHHLAESTVQKAVGEAIEKARIVKKGGCQTLRHSFAVSLFEKHHDLYTVGNLLGHKNPRSTLVYTQIFQHREKSVSSPLDI